MSKLFKQFATIMMALSLLGLLSVRPVFAQTTLPVSVMVYGQHVGYRVIYNYRIINNGSNRVAAVIIGYDDKNDTDPNNDTLELSELPIGWNFDDYKLALPPAASTSPQGWGAKLVLFEETPAQAIEWGNYNNNPQWDISPGQTLSGMSVTLGKADSSYITGHASVNFSDRYPTRLTVPLERLDTTPPTLSVTLSPTTLWPPNGKLVSIHAAIVVQDDYDPEPEIKLESIISSETLADGDIQNAQLGTDDRSFSLAAKRAGNNMAGRIYTVTYSATDASGNKATASATVTVPHDQGKIVRAAASLEISFASSRRRK